RLQRQPATPPAQHRRQPPAECRPPPHRGLPGPRSWTWAPLLPAQAQRGQDPSRGPSSPQAPPGQRHLPAHPGRPAPAPTSLRLMPCRSGASAPHDGTRVLDTRAVHTSHDEGGPMGEQYVGIDLHRRRSVIVRMTGEGEVLDTVRIDNDPVALSLELAKAGPDPEVVLEAT